ncbi:MAG: Zinc/iron permease [Parcubacteria group bacterium GW2011_GWF2_38_76]|nr:MAG: Zinc/iron permease [Parcubacteria group bacterium GW2011_GWF2_38_76]HBM45805.1 ZIP family metal transporter [Patescibacteria group bacterium]
MTLLYILLATLSITFCVFVAVGFLYIKKEILPKILLTLVSLSAGALMGGAFLHLLPESVSSGVGFDTAGLIVLLSFIFFLLVEKFLHWHHCHKANCDIHGSIGRINLLGDSIHNFIDGLVIAASFLVDFNTGIATSLAIALHEIPQEIGDFGVLLYAGYNRKRALIFNYLVATTVVLGGLAGYFFNFMIEGVMPYLLPFAAGGFIYIAASDLIPEVRKETSVSKFMLHLSVFVIGIIFMFLIKFIHE